MENKKLKKKIFENFKTYNMFSRAADITENTIIDIVKNRRTPFAGTVFKICSTLDCNPEDIDLEY